MFNLLTVENMPIMRNISRLYGSFGRREEFLIFVPGDEPCG
jgi:hypothetical protein